MSADTNREMAKKSAAYLLPVEAASSGGPQVFPGFPGIYEPGVPLDIEHLGGIDEQLADALIAELGLPLEKVEMGARKAAPKEAPPEEPGGEN